jgi:hypothetical protein
LACLEICSAPPHHLERPVSVGAIQTTSRAPSAFPSTLPLHLSFTLARFPRCCHSSPQDSDRTRFFIWVLSVIVLSLQTRPDLSLRDALARHWSTSLAGAPSASPTLSPHAHSKSRFSASRSCKVSGSSSLAAAWTLLPTNSHPPLVTCLKARHCHPFPP